MFFVTKRSLRLLYLLDKFSISARISKKNCFIRFKLMSNKQKKVIDESLGREKLDHPLKVY
jgi:hypothetical protein